MCLNSTLPPSLRNTSPVGHAAPGAFARGGGRAGAAPAAPTSGSSGQYPGVSDCTPVSTRLPSDAGSSAAVTPGTGARPPYGAIPEPMSAIPPSSV